MKEVARRKLGLGATASITFSQIRDQTTVDLEDDDDFDAFYSLAHSSKSVDVKVTVNEQQSEGPLSNILTPTKKRKRRRNKGVNSELDEEFPRTPGVQATLAASQPSQALQDAASEQPRKKKKRKVDTADTVVEDCATSGKPTHVPHQSKISTVASGATSSEPSAGNLLVTSSQDSAATTEQQKPRKPRKKKKEKEQAEETSTENQILLRQQPSIENKPAKRRKTKEKQKSSSFPVVEDSVVEVLTGPEMHDSPLETHKHEEFHEKKERRKKSKKQQDAKNPELGDETSNPLPEVSISKVQTNIQTTNPEVSPMDGKEGDVNAISKKSRQGRLESLAADVPKLKADLDDILLRALTRRTAAAVSTSPVSQEDEQSIIVPTSKEKKKKKRRSLSKEALPAESSSTKVGVTEHSKSPLMSREHPTSSVQPICPLCLLSPMHERKKCLVVVGGPGALAKRLSEIQEASDVGHFNRIEIMAEIRELLRFAEKEKETNTLRANSHGPTDIGRSLLVASNMTDITSESISSKKLASSKTTMIPSTEISDASSDDSTSSDDVARPFNELLHISQDPASLADLNLDEIIRGPGLSTVRIADLHSPDSSDDEEDKSRDQALEEDEPEPPRRSRKSGIPDPDSSDDGDSGLDDAPSVADESEDVPSKDASPLDDLPAASGTDHVSFQAVDRIGESEEVDRSADAAFGAALNLDSAVLNAPGTSQASTASEPVTATSMSSTPSPVHMDLDSTLEAEVTPPSTISAPVPSAGPSATQVLMPAPLTTLHDSPSRHTPRDRAKPTDPKPVAGIIQRMKTRNGKTPANEKELDALATPRALIAQASQDTSDSSVRRTRASTRQQTLRTMTPPALPNKLGRQSRLIRPSGAFQSTEDATESSHNDPPSLETWVTLKPSSPMPDADATMMIDELEPSSPHEAHADIDYPNTSDLQDGTNEDPLFFPTESLPAFPYSQWNGEPQKESRKSLDKQADGQQEVEEPVQSQPKPKPSQNPRYRRLTDITIDHGLFSTPTTTTRATRSSMAAMKTDMYGRSGKDDIESESDSESDNSDAQEKSHIPKSRRAGARQTKKK
ncbi:hypothetical protein H0H87_005218 [Tephrocybe sp. NHM501043]|nr:hypothetical protein H0H87_005218 [Tephrocybe sp. NHM501043]